MPRGWLYLRLFYLDWNFSVSSYLQAIFSWLSSKINYSAPCWSIGIHCKPAFFRQSIKSYHIPHAELVRLLKPSSALLKVQSIICDFMPRAKSEDWGHLLFFFVCLFGFFKTALLQHIIQQFAHLMFWMYLFLLSFVFNLILFHLFIKAFIWQSRLDLQADTVSQDFIVLKCQSTMSAMRCDVTQVSGCVHSVSIISCGNACRRA